MLNRNVRPDALSRCRIAYSVGAGPNISVRGRLPTVTARQWVTESKARSENAFDQRDAAAHHQRHLTVLSAIVRVRVYECGRTGGVLYEGLRSPTEVASGSPGPHPQAVQPVFNHILPVIGTTTTTSDRPSVTYVYTFSIVSGQVLHTSI